MEKQEIEQIENPIVRRALEKRCASFMFNYSETRHNDNLGYSEYKKPHDHSEHYEYDKHGDTTSNPY